MSGVDEETRIDESPLCDDQTSVQIELIDKLLSQLSVSEIDPFPNFVTSNIDPNDRNVTDEMKRDAPVIAHYQLCPISLVARGFPMPTHAKAHVEQKILDTLALHAFSEAASLPLFTPTPIYAPIVALLLTGVPTFGFVFKHHHRAREYEKEFETRHNKFFEDNPTATTEDFLDTYDARRLRYNHSYAMYEAREVERSLNQYTPKSWDKITSTYTVFVFYMEIITILRYSHGLTPEHLFHRIKKMKEVIQEADIVYKSRLEEVSQGFLKNPIIFNAVQEIVAQISTNEHVTTWSTEALRQILTSSAIDDMVQDFSISVLEAMEQWILTVCEMPVALHKSLLLTAQPRVDVTQVPKELTSAIRKQYQELHLTRRETFSKTWQDSVLVPEVLHTHYWVRRTESKYEQIQAVIDTRKSIIEAFARLSIAEAAYNPLPFYEARVNILFRKCKYESIVNKGRLGVMIHLNTPKKEPPYSLSELPE